MSNLADYPASEFVKALIIGNSKTRKTTSLAELVKRGYKLRILDFDGLLHPLRSRIEKECPELLGNVECCTLRDKRKYTAAGPAIDGVPKAYMDGVRMLDRWKYGDTDLGVPATWGNDTILVIDSLSRWCDAAYDWRVPLSGKDNRMAYHDAQKAVENNLGLLSGDFFHCNVIIICHIIYQEEDDGTVKGYPQGVGQKLSPKIPQYFPNMIWYRRKGAKYVIQTVSSPLIDLAFAKPFDVKDEYPNETGLGDIFDLLKGPLEVQEPQLRRIK